MLYIQIMSRESANRYKNRERSESQDSLPEEWTSVQKRLDYLEATMMKLQRRSQKLQKRIDEQNQEMTSFKRDTRKMIQEILADQKNELSSKQKQLEFENMKAELEDLHSYLKRIEKKNNEMIKEIKNSGSAGINESIVQERIEEKVDAAFRKHQRETEKVITELKMMVKDYTRDPTPIERKSNENILTNSRSKPSLQKSAQKSVRASYTDLGYNNDVSIDNKQKCKSPPPVVNNNASSRVSYLRDKLKQFEQTNKKYEQKLEKKPTNNIEEKKTVQKMKDFKNYLEQSQSELDQSNIQANPHNVLTDSIKNWRVGERYKYE